MSEEWMKLFPCVSLSPSICHVVLSMLIMGKAYTQFFLYQIFLFASLEPHGNVKTSNEKQTTLM